ncbi:SemiSWEET family sugar transporter [Bradyrhizobium diazoefficiens]|uniref:SemiSWEET family sugar transporter n=1 Tax=Bradyrhizobium diazoefficiens TaxID=1355477 RepID=UPI0038505280
MTDHVRLSLSLSLSLSTYLGNIAAFLASLSYIPQVRKAWPRNSTDDLSLGMLTALTLGARPLGRVRPDAGRLGHRAVQRSSRSLILGAVRFAGLGRRFSR